MAAARPAESESEPDPGPLTEAAGLLTSGLMFPRRVGLQMRQRPQEVRSVEPRAEVLAGFKRGAFALYFGDEPIVHFDPLGRWQRAFLAGVHYLKGLDTQVRAVDRVREGSRLVLRRRTLNRTEVDHLDQRVAESVRSLADSLRVGALDLLAPPAPGQAISPEELLTTLNRIVAWDRAAWADHRRRFERAFGVDPLPRLPPDCPNPLILRPAADLPASSLADHAEAVVALLGDRVRQCRDVYLAGSGWADRPSHDLLDLLAAVAERFPITPDQPRPRAHEASGDAPRFETIYGAIDDPAAILARNHPWPALRAANLGRVALTLPDDPSSRAATPELVDHLRAAEIEISLMVPLSTATAPGLIRLVADLGLRPSDLMALIAESDSGDGSSPDAQALGDWKDRLMARLPNPGPRVVVYNPDKQWL